MLNKLKKIDGALLELTSDDGAVLIANQLKGRIFCSIGNELIHQFRDDLAANPDPVNFNNLGGNSLWPAPEGGDFAYNYPPNGDWMVQDAINRQPTETVSVCNRNATVGKDMVLQNRKGKTVKLRFERRVEVKNISELLTKYQLKGVAYYTLDTLMPQEEYSISQVLVSAWSLEQFPGADGVVAFGKLKKAAEGCVNDDFYGNPHPRLQYRGNCFRFNLGGADRLQIGIKADRAPELIGAYDAARGILIIRTTPVRVDGQYINIADNDQPNGAYSAADRFSIFNGATLNFYELETIAPMDVNPGGILGGSRLESETMIFKGDAAALSKCLEEVFAVPADFIFN